jgi:hypothetical protein
MAKQVVVTMVDDYDGKSQADETVQFSMDGVSYEMDLSTLNASKLRGQLERWTEKARKVGRAPKARSASARITKSGVDRQQTQAIREWAKAHGHDVSSRGRIATEIAEAYHKAIAS